MQSLNIFSKYFFLEYCWSFATLIVWRGWECWTGHVSNRLVEKSLDFLSGLEQVLVAHGPYYTQCALYAGLPTMCLFPLRQCRTVTKPTHWQTVDTWQVCYLYPGSVRRPPVWNWQKLGGDVCWGLHPCNSSGHIRAWTDFCDRGQLWGLHSAASTADPATRIIPTQSHYLCTDQTSPFPILVRPSTRLVCGSCQLPSFSISWWTSGARNACILHILYNT